MKNKHLHEQEEKKVKHSEVTEKHVKENHKHHHQEKIDKGDSLLSLHKEIEYLRNEITSKDTKITELEERNLHLWADFDNTKKRLHKESLHSAHKAEEKIILELLTVLDSFELATKNLETGHAQDELFKGFELIKKQLNDTLSKLGLVKMDCLDQKFDPNLHEALMQVTKEGVEAGIISEVYNNGYYYKGLILRHAKVVITE